MEVLLLTLVIMAIGAVANFVKPADQSDPGGKAGPKKRLGDYAKDFYEEAKKEAESGKKTVIETAKEKAVAATEKQAIARPGRPVIERQTRRERQQKKPDSQAVNKGDLTKRDLFPLEEEDVLKGIILAEIFSPPKSKR
ncbi:hypothetical protein [Planococcus lenghuensis]|uniref:Uncharacterized protein n=1 Tax=Planococcus lenghuensis TaxID=2213202 RepID=A0A1Q2KXW9_9BACL|nr:hypothetical protein [Planococcus lenghuensis]AQQ52966.1 hypothetical protein B0X71_07595 [Planococcus lenghuensis]